MDKKRGLLNIAVSIGFRIALFITAILNRRCLISYVGNDANGLNSLYSSIVGMLAIAELGIGSAISFSMYRPIVENDINKISGLYNLYKKLYLYVGLFILVCGLAFTPFIPRLVTDYKLININVYTTFLLMLVATVITYLYSANTALLNAYKENFITTSLNYGAYIIRDIVQIAVVITFRSFAIYLFVKICFNLIEWLISSIIVSKKHHSVIITKTVIDSATKKEVKKNVRAMFMHKIGTLLVNTSDSMIVSAFIGVLTLGKYANYATISTSISGLLTLFFTPLTSIVGHKFVESKKFNMINSFKAFHTLNFILGLLFFLGFYAVVDDLIILFYGSDLIMIRQISFIITINVFVQFLRESTLLFRNASGAFYYDRWKPLIEGLFNIVLSISFVNIFPSDYAVVGVIAATIITNLLICHVIEPYVLFKYGFKISVRHYYIRNYTYIIVFIVCLLTLNSLMIRNQNIYTEILINGSISILISAIVILVLLLIDANFRNATKSFVSLFRKM